VASGTLSGSARRYADAAFGVARESGQYDVWLNALDQIGRLLGTPAAKAVLTSPTVRPSDKRATLDRLVPNMPPVVRNFAHILIERDRLDQVPEIVEAFRQRVNRERGLLTAEITTAIPLDEGMERAVAQKLGVYLDHDPRRLVVRSHVDPDIIGGVIARVGDTLIDDSVRGRLERLRRVLTAS
jgi:F-type H+-transporting ATPase subunit delta